MYGELAGIKTALISAFATVWRGMNTPVVSLLGMLITWWIYKVNYRFNKTARRPWITVEDPQFVKMEATSKELRLKLTFKNVGLNPLEEVAGSVVWFDRKEEKIRENRIDAINPIANGDYFSWYGCTLEENTNSRHFFYIELEYKDAIFNERHLQIFYFEKVAGAAELTLRHATADAKKALDGVLFRCNMICSSSDLI